MRELFVWYRVAESRAGAARAAVQAMQSALAQAFPGLQARLLIRPGTDLGTWMETYARPGSAAGIDAAIDAEIARRAASALAGLIDGDRHAEVFEPAA